MSNFAKLWLMGASLSLSVIIAKHLVILGLHPIYLAMLQALGSVIILASFGVRGLFKSLKTKISYYFWASILGFTIPQLVVFYSVKHVGASIVALAYAFPLFMTFLLSVVLAKQQIKLRPILFMLAAFIGSLVYLFKPDVISFSAEQLNWLFLLCLAPITLSIANVYRTTRWPTGVPIFHVALLTNAFSFITYFVLAAFYRPDGTALNELESLDFLLVAVFILIAAAGQFMLFSLQKTAAPSFIGQTGSITTFCGGLLGFVFFQESYQLSTFIGSILILLGVAGFSRISKPIQV